MAYNTISGDYYISQMQTKEDVPYHLMRYAVVYRDQLDSFEPDMRSVLQHIVDNFLQEGTPQTQELTGSDATDLSGGSAATAAEHIGNVDLSGGHDWATTNETFTVDGTTVTLDADTADLTATITEINDALTAAAITGVEAFSDGNNVGIRTTADGADQSFTLGTGTTDALATLGLSAGTYTGSDATEQSGTRFETTLDASVEDGSTSVTVNGTSRTHSVDQQNPLIVILNSAASESDEVTISVSDALTVDEYFSVKPLIDPMNHI